MSTRGDASPTAVVFDYYETLAHLTMDIRERLFDDLARELGLDLPPGEGYRHWRELTTKDWVLRLGSEKAPLDGPRPEFRTFREVWTARSRELFEHWGVDAPAERGSEAYGRMHAEAVAYPEVPAALEALRGTHRLAVLSDADSDHLQASIGRNGLTFDVVVASEDVRVYKPHVSIFQELCARLSIQPSEAVYVGDSPWADIAGARNAGMRAVWVNRHNREWPDDIEPPHHVVTSLAELGGILR